jgi:phosphodiesterase/alkaline phosphatase D-like protein
MQPDRRTFLQLLAAAASASGCGESTPTGADAATDLGADAAADAPAVMDASADAGAEGPDALVFDDSGPREDVPVEAVPNDPGGVFIHGVASGDPLPTAVILWTRATPSRTAPPMEVMVQWEAATDVAFTRIVAMGTATTTAARDYTVKVDAEGLRPGVDLLLPLRASATYARRSAARAPPRRARSTRLRLAVVSCASRAFRATSTCTARSPSASTSTPSCTSATTSTSTRRGVRQRRAGSTLPRTLRSLSDYRRRYACTAATPTCALSTSSTR